MALRLPCTGRPAHYLRLHNMFVTMVPSACTCSSSSPFILEGLPWQPGFFWRVFQSSMCRFSTIPEDKSGFLACVSRTGSRWLLRAASSFPYKSLEMLMSLDFLTVSCFLIFGISVISDFHKRSSLSRFCNLWILYSLLNDGSHPFSSFPISLVLVHVYEKAAYSDPQGKRKPWR